nr:MAG: DNA pilot protein [Microvirus sp.]
MDLGGLGGLIGGAAGWVFGGPAGGAVGAQIGGGIDTNAQNRNSAEQAQAFSAQQYATRYQTQVADMKAAGLNPMLAYQQSPGSSPTGVTYRAENPYSDTSKHVSNIASAGQADAASKQAVATVARIGQEITNLKTDNEKGLAVIRNLGEEFQNLMKQGWNLTEVGNQLRASVSLMRAQTTSEQFRPALIAAQQAVQVQLQKLQSEQTSLTAVDVRAAEAFGELGKTVGTLEPFLKLLWNIFRR